MVKYALYFATNEIFCTFVANYKVFVKMKENIIGRVEEQQTLARIFASRKSEFVAVYGRRRVGKTFLVREYFEGEMVFQTAGLAHQSTSRQLKLFYEDLIEWGLPRQGNAPADWIEAFSMLRALLKASPRERKVLLLDELPWMDTPRSGFMAALEHFWNSWASARHDIVLIVCGSATSWMMDKLINNHGGLHNRLTQRIFLPPFTLRECEDFLRAKGFYFSRYDVAVCYMILGGIPYYLDMLDTRLSLAQNIDNLLFRDNGALVGEFNNLYSSLFANSEDYISIVRALSTKRVGLTRNEVIRATGIGSGSGLTTMLRNLEACGFIRAYRQYKAGRGEDIVYQLIEFFTLFHFRFIWSLSMARQWEALQGKAEFFVWAGLSFELLVLRHARLVKRKLSIEGVVSREYMWRCADEAGGAQVDLVIDRDDNTVNLCEMKFSIDTFEIDKAYESNLRNKLAQFMRLTGMKKSLQLTMVTTYGVAPGIHSGIVTNQVTLDDLFA